MHRCPRTPLDGVVHPSEPQTHQVPQQGQDETFPGQAQMEGNMEWGKEHWTDVQFSYQRLPVMTFQSIVPHRPAAWF